MKNQLYKYLLAAFTGLSCGHAGAQGLHFSQYYNAPVLLNPANTALMSDNDYRLGVNYRRQWNSIVPYTTTSAYADFQAFRNMNATNWLGIGFAVFNDKAGDGELSLTRLEGCLAYHVMIGEYSMISAGLSAATDQRSINYNKLTFDEQWVGRNDVTFDINLPNQEHDGIVKTNFFDIGAGVNYAFFPNEATYFKIGASVAHINSPEETFYDSSSGTKNKLGIRPSANADLVMNVSDVLTINPSLYYTTQKNASEFLFGSLGMISVNGGDRDHKGTELIVGGYYRWQEAVIVALGLQWSNLRFMLSYDYTVSSFSTENKGNGAAEFAISYQGVYGSLSRGRRTINCPRF